MAGAGTYNYLILLLTLSGIANADTGIPLSENDFLKNIPQAVAATRQSLPLSHSPSSVTIISRDMIEAMPTDNLADLLKLVPGFQVFFANGSIQAVTANGQSDRFPRRLEIRVDGRTVYTPINSSVSWESLALDPNDINHIEVVRGSNIAAYGANAAQGAINIFTRDPLASRGTELRLTGGDWDTRNISVRHSTQLGGNAVTLRAKYRENQGFDDLDDQSYVDSLALQGVHSQNFNNELRWELGYSDGNFGFGDGDHPDEIIDEDIDAHWLALEWQQRRHDHLITTRLSANMGVYDHSRTGLLSQALDLTPAQLSLQFPGAIDRPMELEVGRREYRQYDFELEHSFPLTQRGNFLWGFGARHQEVKAPNEFSNSSYQNYDSLFLFSNLQWQFDNRLSGNLGLFAEQNDQTSTGLSPRLSLNYQVSPQQHLRLSGSVARRLPSLYERERLIQLEVMPGTVADLIYISDPDLGAEKFQTYEFGYLGYWFDGRLSVDYRLFREYMDDGIDYIKYPYPDLDDKYRLLENVAEYRMSGYESQIQWRPAATWLVSFQYANVRIDGTIVHPDKTTQLAKRTPVHTGSLLVSKRLPGGWSISGAVFQQSRVSWRGGSKTIPGWHRYDLKIGKLWRIAGKRVELAGIAQNLSDEEYIEYQDGNTFGRHLLLQLEIDI